MGKPTPPAPPDPKETSSAQTGTNIGTAIANNTMGMVNQTTPYGSLTYDQTGTQSWTDPYTGQTYELPQYSATTTLNPQQQATLESNQAAQGNLADTALERSAFLKDYLPSAGAATDAIDQKLYDLGSQRLDPRFSRQEEDLRTRLTNQGITAGSEAWKREMDQFGQTQNDAYNQLLLQGRGQAAAEVNMPINQITALLSGSQVQNPNVNMVQPQGIATTDVAGNIMGNFDQRMGQYNAQMDQYGRRMGMLGGFMGGLFG